MQCLSKAAYLYPASFILYTPGSKEDNVFCSRTQHNDPAGNCTPNFGSGVHTTAPGPPRLPRTRRTNNYTRPVCSLGKHRKLLVQSRNKHILHHWSILRWDLSSTHLKRNWKKNENKGKERKKKKEWFLSLLSLSRIWFMSYIFCQSWRVVPSEMDSLYYQCH